MALRQGQCPHCHKGKLIRDSEQRSMSYKGHTITYRVPGATCQSCGQRYVGPYGAGVAGDRVRAQEAAIDARERRKSSKPPRVKYQSQEEFFEDVTRDVAKLRAGKLKRPVVTVSADPSWRPPKRRAAGRKPSRKS